MRNTFFDSLYECAKKDKDVVVLMSDTGATVLDDWRRDLPNQCINVGIAEQNQIGVAAGMAMCGKKVFCYAIVPFITSRVHDQVRVDLCCQNLPVALVGVGVGFDYSTLGPTHHGVEDIAIMRCLPNMQVWSPSDNDQTAEIATHLYKHQDSPAYVRVDRTGDPNIQRDYTYNLKHGYSLLKPAGDTVILATGRMVYTALEATRGMPDVGVVDIFRIKPLNELAIIEIVSRTPNVIVAEHHSVIGGLGSAVVECLSRHFLYRNVKLIGMPDAHCREYGSRACLEQMHQLDIKGFGALVADFIN